MKNEMNKRQDAAITPELLEKAKANDREALSQLYEKTHLDIYRTVHSMVRDEDLTMDIQQDTYLKAFSRLDQLRDAASFLPWLRQIAVNEARAQLTKKHPMVFSELSDDEEEDTLISELPDLRPDASPEMTLDRKETSRLIREILGGLSDGQRMLLGMFYYEQLPLSRIAEDTGLSVGTIKAQLHRGRKRVETEVKKLEAQGVKLYGLSPLPFLLALMRQQSPAAETGEALLAKTLAKAGVAAGTKAAASAAAPVVLQATKPFFSTTLGKVVLGVAAAAVVVGGAAGYRWARNNLFEKTAPILMVDSSEDLQNDPTAPTMPVEVDVTGPTVPVERDDTAENLVTEPVVTEPAVTEPAVTEPSGTEPTETEPVGTDPSVTEPSGAEPAQPVRADNQCGEHLTWSFDPETGWLTIAGSGPMDDYADVTDTPWYSIRSEITRVNVPDGLTAIGDNAFAGCTALEYAWLSSEQLCRIGAHAFDGCANGSFTLYSYSSTNDRAPLELGDYAFRGCSLYTMICPYYVTRIGTGAFADCNMTKLWIINADCAIGAAVTDPSVTLRGLPDSAAARYAAQNANPFDPMTESSRDSVVGLLEQGGINLRYDGLFPYDSRFVLNVVRADRVTATEAEIQQAAQTGTIVLAGQEYPYADSVEEAAKWSAVFTNSDCNFWTGVNSDEVVGWIQRSGEYYKVLRLDDHYVFCRCSSIGEWDPYLNEFVDLGWLWLDADNPYNTHGDYKPLSESRGFYYIFDASVCGLSLNDEGQIVPSWNSAGRK